MTKPRAVIVLLMCVASVSVASICTNTTIGRYTYDLTPLNNVTSLPGYTLNLCSKIACVEPSNYLYNSFIVQTQGQSCFVLTRPFIHNLASIEIPTTSFNQIGNGLTFNYSVVTKANGTKVMSTVDVICSNSPSKLDNVSVTMQNQTTIYHFAVSSAAGCWHDPDTQIWQYFRNKQLIFALVFWAIGLYSMFFGHFMVRLTVLIYGIVTAAGFSLISFTFNYPDYDQSTSVLNWILILSCIFGIVYGFFLLTLPRFGYFNIGVWFGVIICLLLQNAAFSYGNTLIPFYVCLGVICFVCGVAGIMGFKYFIIVSTAVISGFLLVRPLGFFLPYYPNEFNFYKTDERMPWQYYLYLIAIMILALISAIFQAWLVKKRGRKDKLYSLQDNLDFKTKLKNLLQFKQIKEFINNGTDQFNIFKNMLKSKGHAQIQQESGYRRSSDIEQYADIKKPQPVRPEPKKQGRYVPPAVSDDGKSDQKSIEMVQLRPKPNSNRSSRSNQRPRK